MTALDAATARAKTRHRTRWWSRQRAFLLLVLPFAVGFLLVYVAPALYALGSSFLAERRDGPLSPPHTVFAGLDQYVSALTDSTFWNSMLTVLTYALGPGLLVVIVGLVLALLIDARRPGILTRFFRLGAFITYGVPVVIGSILWGFLYAPFGPLSSLLGLVGVQSNLLSDGWVLFAVANIGIWTFAGYNMMIFLAALGTIDPALYEAALLDGARPWRMVISIKLPLIRPAIVLVLVFHLIGTIQLFTEPEVLRRITNSISSGWTPNMLSFAQATSGNYYYGAAISVLLAIVAGAASWILMRVLWKRGQ